MGIEDIMAERSVSAASQQSNGQSSQQQSGQSQNSGSGSGRSTRTVKVELPEMDRDGMLFYMNVVQTAVLLWLLLRG